MKENTESENHRKGLEIPTNIIVVVVIAVLVIVVLATYFSGVMNISMSEVKANEIFRTGCMEYCKADTKSNYINAYLASYEDTEFIMACERLGYGTRDRPNRCFEKCGKNFCDMDVTLTDVENEKDQIIQCLQAGTC